MRTGDELHTILNVSSHYGENRDLQKWSRSHLNCSLRPVSYENMGSCLHSCVFGADKMLGPLPHLLCSKMSISVPMSGSGGGGAEGENAEKN